MAVRRRLVDAAQHCQAEGAGFAGAVEGVER